MTAGVSVSEFASRGGCRVSRWKYAIPGLFLAATLAAAAWQGRAAGRWTPLPPLDPYVDALAAVPAQLGEWQGTDTTLDDPDSLKRGGIDGYLSRRYRHRRTGDEVVVLIVCGRPGPISVHTPDVCYRGAGFTAVGEPALVDCRLPDRKLALWDLRFHPPAARAGDADLEIRWGWLAGGPLEAPANPRLAFAGKPALYKLYVIRERRPQAAAKPSPAGPAAEEPVAAFLAAMVPALEASLTPTGGVR